MIVAAVLLPLLFSCSGKNKRSDAYGTFEATEISVSPEISGRLLAFQVEEGQNLKEGQLIALLDSTDHVLRLQMLRAQQQAVANKLESLHAQAGVLEQQKTNLEVDLERTRKLFADQAATQKQLDDVSGSHKLLLKQIQAVLVQRKGVSDEIEALSQQIAQARENLRKCRILNPADGTVLEKYHEASEMVMAGKPLYKIADLSEMYLRVYISGSQLPQVKIGQEAEVIIDADKDKNRTLSGTVSWISSSAEFTPKIIQTKEERVNLVYAVRVRVKNDGSLKIAMPGEVNFR